MLGRTYEREHCSAARALEIVGERWSLLILRNAMFGGLTRFTEMQRALGIASNILSARLDWFVANGLMEVQPVAGDSELSEYVLTPKGLDLQPVIIALSAWGDRWSAPDGPPILYDHDGCGGRVHQDVRCERCGAALHPGEIVARPGPGMPAERLAG